MLVSREVTIELLKIVPSILWVSLVAVLVAMFYKPIRNDLLPRASGIKAFGLEATFVEQRLDEALEERKIEASASERSRLLRRMERAGPALIGAQILWVDDEPSNNAQEIQTLSSLGIATDLAASSEEALSILPRKGYDAVISDMERDGDSEEGLRFLSEMRENLARQPVIFYVGEADTDRGVPARAFGITDRPDHLLHLVLDVLERERG